MTVGSLFAGIGGFDLGLERAGFEIRWQVEIDPFCRAVLAKHWPQVKRYEDIRTVGAELERVDVICGGFPCQDISNAGHKAGIGGERSGLWGEMARVVGVLRPRYALVENVSALLGRGVDRVLGDLAAIGYDAEWSVVSACAVGAPHSRERVWILAYSSRSGLEGRSEQDGQYAPKGRIRGGELTGGCSGSDRWWSFEPDVGRVAYGIPARVDRLRGLGNAVVPQITEWIGRRILEAEVITVRDYKLAQGND